jgi:hypothetical protein
MIYFLSICVLLFFQEKSEIPIYKSEPADDRHYIGVIDPDDTTIIHKEELLPGCSWYCGGHVDSVKASSALPPSKNIYYSAKNAHDFDPLTAWITKKGKGEYIEYTVDTRKQGDHHLGVTSLIMLNGYRKSRDLWKANSRVKCLIMSVDDKPYAKLELLDSYEVQVVKFDKIMLPKSGLKKFKFTIVDVYKGSKYNDTAISEMVFDGVGVH